MSSAKRHLIVDCLSDSIRMYTASGESTIHEYFTDAPLRRVPKQVRWAEDDRVVVVGSDKGLVYVFDVETKEKIEVIHHSQNSMVQTIAVS